VLAAGAFWWMREAPPTNVLLITLDTTRADHIGCYGYAAARTTAISLAAAGVTFEKSVRHRAMFLPSHASILTGLYPPEAWPAQ
jgi:arylsulfatase A-like enzyme